MIYNSLNFVTFEIANFFPIIVIFFKSVYKQLKNYEQKYIFLPITLLPSQIKIVLKIFLKLFRKIISQAELKKFTNKSFSHLQ